MSTGTGNLPNQNMDFVPLAELPASDLDKLVENIESLADGSGIGDDAIDTSKIADNSITSDKLGTNAATMNNGWISTSDTWTYASASTFTVAGDQTAKYHKGTRIKFTQNTTVKYGVVVSSAFTSLTTVTIAVNTDYTIANAAITDNYYSYAANPQGYPVFFNYTPIVTCPSGTAPTYSFVNAYYSVIGGIVTCTIKLQNTSGGTAGASANPIFVSPPIAPLSNVLVLGYGLVYESGGTIASVTARYGSATTFYFHTSAVINIFGQDQSSDNRYMTFTLNYPLA